MKRIEWMTLPQWMGLTAEQHRRLDAYLKEQNAELGIDIDGSRTRGQQLRFESDPDELDREEYIEDMGLGGKRYRVKR